MFNSPAAYPAKSRRLFFLFLFVWFLLNIIQSIFTEIGNDESYYWVYSQQLDWGYFDHPPMVALIVRMGTMLAGDTTLGVRLFIMLMQVLFLIVLFLLTREGKARQDIKLFFLVSFSVVMLQAYGFIATPDAPLLFFTALFLWSYRHFIENEYSSRGALLMAVCMAGLMYSKYHGALVIILVILSNLKLLRKPTFYMAVLVGIGLFLPHLLWQVHNDFPSLKYHLVERSKGFKWSYFPDFLVNQLPVFNPFTLGAGIYVLFRRKKVDLFERALKFLFAGFLIFFTFWNFKGRVEPHWTIVAAVPMIILIVREALVDRKLTKYLYKVVAPSLVLVMIARVFLMIDILPVSTEWHGDKQRIADLETVAGERPVVFISGFQMASKYRFYTGREAHAMGALNYRNTQYDIWDFDENYRGKPVVLEFRNDTTNAVSVQSGTSLFHLKEVEAYQPYKKLQVTPVRLTSFIPGTEHVVPVTVENPYSKAYVIDHPSMPLEISLVFHVEREGRIIREKIPTISIFEWHEIAAGEEINGQISFFLPDVPAGEYQVYFAAGTPGVYPATLDKPVKIYFGND